MRQKLLMIHGNGGANARFTLFEKLHSEQKNQDFDIVLPKLPGFEGRPLPTSSDLWEPFLNALSKEIEQAPR